jgi:hypothetical protein
VGDRNAGEEPPIDWFYPNQGYGDDRAYPYFGDYLQWAVCMIPGHELVFGAVTGGSYYSERFQFLWDGTRWHNAGTVGNEWDGPIPVGKKAPAQAFKLMSWIDHDIL